MLRQQAIESAVAGLPGQSEIISCVAAPPGARGGDVLGKDIRPAPLDPDADIEREPVVVTVHGDRFRRHPSGRATVAAIAMGRPCSAWPSSHNDSEPPSPSLARTSV